MTPMYDYADMNIFGYVDDVVERVMKKLELDIPEFRLNRWVQI